VKGTNFCLPSVVPELEKIVTMNKIRIIKKGNNSGNILLQMVETWANGILSNQGKKAEFLWTSTNPWTT
jgi:hypothetical protein